MNIGLYSDPVNIFASCYRGIYRQNYLMDFYECSDIYLIKVIESYFKISYEGFYADYSKDNQNLIESIYGMLTAKGWRGDILLFSDQRNAVIPDEFCFIGYDICSDSKYYSPIGDGLLHSYNKSNVFFSQMDISTFLAYKGQINDNGLFSQYSTALGFSMYCNAINRKYGNSVESEEYWRPFAIYINNAVPCAPR